VPEFFRIELLEPVRVIELEVPQTLDAVEFDRLNESILDALDGCADQPWVLDLSRVGYIGSAMLGLIVNLRQRIKTGNGRLVLCGLSNRLHEIFRACSMERLFTITKTRPDAIRVVSR
jgi:anti-anti-sigma factor